MERRRAQLDEWRKKTGRTPMKRLSYLLPCAQDSISKPSLHSHSVYLQRTRRVELSAKKSVRKPPRNVLTPLNGGVKTGRSHSRAERELAVMKEQFQRDLDDTVAEILAEQEEGRGHQRSSGEASTETFRRNHIAIALGFEEAKDGSQEGADISNRSLRKRKRRSTAFYVDEELAFESSKICYATTVFSEQRGLKRRRSRHRHSYLGPVPSDQEDTTTTTPGGRGLLYLTPVRRSTRVRRTRSVCPQPHGENESTDLPWYFDSPGQAERREGYDGVKVLPNAALI